MPEGIGDRGRGSPTFNALRFFHFSRTAELTITGTESCVMHQRAVQRNPAGLGKARFCGVDLRKRIPTGDILFNHGSIARTCPTFFKPAVQIVRIHVLAHHAPPNPAGK